MLPTQKCNVPLLKIEAHITTDCNVCNEIKVKVKKDPNDIVIYMGKRFLFMFFFSILNMEVTSGSKRDSFTNYRYNPNIAWSHFHKVPLIIF